MNKHPKFGVFKPGMHFKAGKQQRLALHNNPLLPAKHTQPGLFKRNFLAATGLKMNQLLPFLLF